MVPSILSLKLKELGALQRDDQPDSGHNRLCHELPGCARSPVSRVTVTGRVGADEGPSCFLGTPLVSLLLVAIAILAGDRGVDSCTRGEPVGSDLDRPPSVIILLGVLTIDVPVLLHARLRGLLLAVQRRRARTFRRPVYGDLPDHVSRRERPPTITSFCRMRKRTCGKSFSASRCCFCACLC